MKEAFKPIAVGAPGDRPVLFLLRCLVDLQVLTVYRFLRRELRGRRGLLVDVGAGHSPWAALADACEYLGVDIESAAQFGMSKSPKVIYFNGQTIPLPDATADHVLSSEVLEHVPDEHQFMAELARILKPGGALVLTVPWSARLHHLPSDYRRLAPAGLVALLGRHGFVDIKVEARGSAVCAIANKLVVQCISLLRPKRPIRLIWTVPLGLLLLPVAVAFLGAAHWSLWFGLGANEDPLGFGVVATRDGQTSQELAQ